MMDAVCKQRGGKQVGWEEFIPFVLPYVFGAPEELVMDAVRSASIEFCRVTNVLQRLFVSDLYKGVETYLVEDPGDGYRVGLLLRAVVSGRAYPALSEYPPGGRGRGVFFDRPSRVHLFPAPHKDDPDGLELDISLYPAPTSCYIDEEFFLDHAEDVALGAISRLLQVPDMSWTDRAAAETFNRRFKNAINRTKVRMAKGYQAGPLIAKAGRRWY